MKCDICGKNIAETKESSSHMPTLNVHTHLKCKQKLSGSLKTPTKECNCMKGGGSYTWIHINDISPLARAIRANKSLDSICDVCSYQKFRSF